MFACAPGVRLCFLVKCFSERLGWGGDQRVAPRARSRDAQIAPLRERRDLAAARVANRVAPVRASSSEHLALDEADAECFARCLRRRAGDSGKPLLDAQRAMAVHSRRRARDGRHFAGGAGGGAGAGGGDGGGGRAHAASRRMCARRREEGGRRIEKKLNKLNVTSRKMDGLNRTKYTRSRSERDRGACVRSRR